MTTKLANGLVVEGSPKKTSERKRTFNRRPYMALEPLHTLLPGITLPLSSTKKSGEKNKPTIRPYLAIEPLRFTPESEKHPAKKRKVDKPVRKELFRVPVKKGPVKRISSRKTISSLKKVLNDGSPLLDMDKEEAKLLKEMPKIIVSPARDEATTTLQSTPVKVQPPKNDNSETEFLNLEKIFASAKKAPKEMSPLTSVCSLLERAKISNTTTRLNQDVLTVLQDAIQEYQSLKEQFQCFEIKMKAVENLLLEQNKENDGPKVVVSPAVAEKVDLRKTALTKSLPQGFHVGSPRTRKAVNMYNSFRNNYSVLCTPLSNKKSGSSLQNTVTRSLSRRLQDQCLLLQDTPQHKADK